MSQPRVRMLFVSTLGFLAVGAAAAQSIPYVQQASEAGKAIASMDVGQLLGTISIISMALAGFMGYLLYRSQRELWGKVIVTLDEIKGAIRGGGE